TAPARSAADTARICRPDGRRSSRDDRRRRRRGGGCRERPSGSGPALRSRVDTSAGVAPASGVVLRAGDALEVVDAELLAAGGGRDPGPLQDLGCRGRGAAEEPAQSLPQHLAPLLERGVDEGERAPALDVVAAGSGGALEGDEHGV